MIRTLTLIATLSALAAPAFAAEIKLNIVGKDQATIHSEVTAAAKSVCRDSLKGSPLAFYMQSGCVKDAVSVAMAQVGMVQAVYAAPTPLAVTRISADK